MSLYVISEYKFFYNICYFHKLISKYFTMKMGKILLASGYTNPYREFIYSLYFIRVTDNILFKVYQCFKIHKGFVRFDEEHLGIVLERGIGLLC